MLGMLDQHDMTFLHLTYADNSSNTAMSKLQTDL